MEVFARWPPSTEMTSDRGSFPASASKKSSPQIQRCLFVREGGVAVHLQVRGCVHDFYQSRYSECLRKLLRIKPLISLDLHLHQHINDLYTLIRQKAMIQFTFSYKSVGLARMAESFNVSVRYFPHILGSALYTRSRELERELVQLITADKIFAKIDSANGILYTRQYNVRRNTFRKAVKMTNHYLQENKALLVRLNLIKHDLMQRVTSGERRSFQSRNLPSSPIL